MIVITTGYKDFGMFAISSLNSLVSSLMPTWPPLRQVVREGIQQEIVSFIRAELRLAPAHIRIGVAILTISFFFAAFLFGKGRGFRKKSIVWRKEFIERWERWTPHTRALIRLYRSFTLLAFLENPRVTEVLRVEDARQHQERYRAIRKSKIGVTT